MLLEVLIAFAIVALCAIPLISPHAVMLKAQRQFVRKMELDHAVNLLYGNVLEKLYLNKINWTELTLQNPFEITPDLLKEAHYDKPFGYSGSYVFTEDKHKPEKLGNYNLFQFTLRFTFLPDEFKNSKDELKQKNTLEYKYKVFIVRDLRPPGAASVGNITQPQASPTPSAGSVK